MEAALARSFAPEAIKDITIPQDGLNSDIHASAEYRAHLVGVMARRAGDRIDEKTARNLRCGRFSWVRRGS
jgi:hypothetical protein